MPLHRHHLGSPLPDEPSPVLRCTACQAVHSCRPCRSTRLRRFTPPGASQVCCTLQPIMGFAVFRSTRARLEVVRDEAGSPLQRMPFEAFPSQVAVTCHHVPCPPVVAREVCSASALRQLRPLPRSLDLRAFLHLRSRSERSTVTSRVLPVASLGFSFQSVSCPTRHSSELRATAIGKPIAGGLLVHPRRTLGQQPPSPMVLIGSAEQSRRAARPERRRSQRRPTSALAHATRFVLVGGNALGALLAHCRSASGDTDRACLTTGFSVRTTQAIHTKGTSSRSPESSDCLQGKPCVPSSDRAANVAVGLVIIACRRATPLPVKH